jgi:hypothetical protein
MTKSYLPGAVVIGAALLLSASAASAQTSEAARWTGEVKLLNASAGCDGFDVIDNFPALGTFRPKINQGEANSALSLDFGRGSAIFQTTSSSSQMHGKGKYEGVVITGSVTYRSRKGSYDFDISPASIVAKTKKVSIKGTITEFWNDGFKPLK